MTHSSRAGAAVIAAAVASAAIGFVIHVFSVEVVEHYVASVMAGRQVAPSWDVRVPAALSSIEQGLALVTLYLLVRSRLPSLGTLARGLLVAVIALALGGNLVRQPLMNLLIGNPLEVVAVQGGMTWLIWGVMGIIAASVLDFLLPQPSEAKNGLSAND